jgi:hypothetical protein
LYQKRGDRGDRRQGRRGDSLRIPDSMTTTTASHEIKWNLGARNETKEVIKK